MARAAAASQRSAQVAHASELCGGVADGSVGGGGIADGSAKSQHHDGPMLRPGMSSSPFRQRAKWS